MMDTLTWLALTFLVIGPAVLILVLCWSHFTLDRSREQWMQEMQQRLRYKRLEKLRQEKRMAERMERDRIRRFTERGLL